MFKCKNCGSNDTYDIVCTADGYKEYRCKFCGGILYRVNLIEEYKVIDPIHNYDGDCNEDSLAATLNKYQEDQKAVSNFIIFVSNKLFETNEQGKIVAYNQIINEYKQVLKNINAYIEGLTVRLNKLRAEKQYEECSISIANEYDSTKKYVDKSKLSLKIAVWQICLVILPLAVHEWCWCTAVSNQFALDLVLGGAWLFWLIIEIVLLIKQIKLSSKKSFTKD